MKFPLRKKRQFLCIYIYCSQRLEQKSIYQPGFFFADLGDLGRSLESEFFRQFFFLARLLYSKLGQSYHGFDLSLKCVTVFVFFLDSSNNKHLKIGDFFQSHIKPFQRSSINQFLEFLIGFWRLLIFETYKEPSMNITLLMTNIYPEKGPFQSGK